MVVYALLDGPSLAGAYRFAVEPGKDTVAAVQATLFARSRPGRLGLAPLTSMFWHAENSETDFGDFRPRVHDSDGLLMHAGSGEWIWRPLRNPMQIELSAFQDRNPRGFGLLQRERDFAFYQDLEAHYEQRPSAWVEPVGDWGAGSVVLIEMPSDIETNDNIVAFWEPKDGIRARRAARSRLPVALVCGECSVAAPGKDDRDPRRRDPRIRGHALRDRLRPG